VGKQEALLFNGPEPGRIILTDNLAQQWNSIVPVEGWTPDRRFIEYGRPLSPHGFVSGADQLFASTEAETKDALRPLVDMMRKKADDRLSERTHRHPELSIVSLARPVEAEGATFPPGSRGTVVHVYDGEKAYIVEFERPIHAVVTVGAGSIEE
jgi:hypothetical protein